MRFPVNLNRYVEIKVFFSRVVNYGSDIVYAKGE